MEICNEESTAITSHIPVIDCFTPSKEDNQLCIPSQEPVLTETDKISIDGESSCLQSNQELNLLSAEETDSDEGKMVSSVYSDLEIGTVEGIVLFFLNINLLLVTAE